MKKNLLYTLTLTLLLLTGCSSSDRTGAADQPEAAYPAESRLEGSITEQPAPESFSVVECEAISGYDNDEMHEFLVKAMGREPASIQLTSAPEEGGDSTVTTIVYDCVTFTVSERTGDTATRWYYTDLEATPTPAGTVEYRLTGLGTFEDIILQCPLPDTYFLTEEPADIAVMPTAKSETIGAPADAELTAEYPSDTAIANGDYVNLHGEIYNADVMDAFLTKVAALEEAAIRTVEYTVEGDAILKDVSYDGSVFAVTVDTTRDAFGPQETYTNYYARLETVYLPEQDITEYRLTDPEGMGQDRPLDYIVLKYDLGDTTAS